MTAGVIQLVECLTCNENVAGANPAASLKKNFEFSTKLFSRI